MSQPASTIQIGTKVGGFEITGFIGAGGMGEVYRARDLKLGREVAIKFISESISSDPKQIARFEREARLLASVNHANIATIHSLERVDGAYLLVMELLRGRDLAGLIKQGPLELDTALKLFCDVARGLIAAHEAGVIHRDIKPSNIVVSESSLAKLLDFGIATTMQPAAGPAAAVDPNAPTSQMLVQSTAGVIVGTPAYFSPEQARGGLLDERSDIWAFGCSLYEALTGVLPFARTTLVDSLAAILQAEPDWALLPNSTPRPLVDLLKACLQKNAAQRPGSMREVLERLEAIRSLPRATVADTPQRTASKSFLLPFAVIGAIAFVAAGAYAGYRFLGAAPVSPAPEQSPPLRDQIAVTEAAPVTAPEPAAVAPQRFARLAVLPFASLGEPVDEYLGEGLADSIVDRLSRVRSLSIVSRRSAAKYEDSNGRAGEIARELDVEALVEGAITASERRINVRIALIGGSNGDRVWEKTYEVEREELPAGTAEIALDIANEIRAAVTEEESGAIRSDADIEPEAFDAYLRGRSLWRQGAPEDIQRAIEYFARAAQLDPAFAPPVAALAEAYISSAVRRIMPSRAAYRRAIEQATRAVEIDGTSAPAHAALGTASMAGADPARVLEPLQRAMELDPGYAPAYEDYANALINSGRVGDGIGYARKALDIDPLSDSARMQLAYGHMALGEYGQALTLLEQISDGDSPNDFVVLLRAQCYRQLGQGDEAVAVATQWVDASGRRLAALCVLSQCLAASGDTDTAKKILNEVLKRAPAEFGFEAELSALYAALGDTPNAVKWLNESVSAGWSWSMLCLSAPWWDAIRTEPAFRSAASGFGFDAPTLDGLTGPAGNR